MFAMLIISLSLIISYFIIVVSGMRVAVTGTTGNVGRSAIQALSGEQ